MEEILEVTDLCKTFSNGSVQQHVLKNLNINIYKGDFTRIMGRSGSGKSTLLYGLSGMDRPTLGSIKYENEEISKYSNNELALFRRKHCGFVFQHNYLNDSMTEFNSHKDRHENIGKGSIGLDAIINLINHPLLKNIPFFLETPCENEELYKNEIDLLKENYK